MATPISPNPPRGPEILPPGQSPVPQPPPEINPPGIAPPDTRTPMAEGVA